MSRSGRPVEPFRLTASEAARAIARGRLTSETLVRSCLERIEAHEAKVQAWAFLDPALAIRRARMLDRTRRSYGPLHGIPIGLKDIIDTADMPTEYNSRIYRGYRPAADAACVARLREAGAIILGKTATSEFAGLSPAQTRNPHDFRHTPGGSSSGSAASVGDLMVPAALGTQTGGSTIRPAAYCGAHAFKPSYRRIPVSGVKLIAPSYDTLGIISRSVDDLALLDAVLSGERAGRLRDQPIETLRVAYCETPFWPQADKSTHRALKEVAASLQHAGARVTQVELPPEIVTLSEGFYIVVSAEAVWSLGREYRENKELISSVMRRLIGQGAVMDGDRIQEIRRVQTICSIEVDRIFDRYDVVLTPAGPGEAPRGRGLGNNEFNRMWTAMHLPCLTLPVGRGANGLPIGVQLVGRRGDDRRLLMIGKQIEKIVALRK
jgi:Asp-tRNA(Asn)/Glu-tRNA(Gln) amidotransferase A subunit family amidase